ncbi:sialidase family protein [Sphingobacterium sp. SYP-B4668]|uniref:sialidase family protein n=1 Tax=Sphingobacterium sp. SYP-B4668 TaxID=2996035 RepID=UPI0022DD986C|nr:sialidase family protein [Sphingobacterium sp. SYP-B4668]
MKTKKINLLLLLFLFGAFQAHGQEISKETLVLKLAPSAGNPRNSEGDFVQLKNGNILFVYSRYFGTSDSDHGTAVLAARYSDNQGKTWSKEDRTIVKQDGKMNVMSVSLLRLRDKRIALFYLRKNSVTDCIPMVRYSSDEGETWSEAIQVVQDKAGYFVLNNNRVIQLKNGRLIMAVALHHTPNGVWQGKADLYAYYSDDSGQTWKSSKQVPNATDIITQEPGLVELNGDRLMMFIRASGGKQQLSYSEDKGMTWSAIEASSIVSPLSPASIARIPKTGDLLLVWNNSTKGRTPLTSAISKDEGKTWENIKVIESDPDGWYCYIAIHFLKKNVLLSYCAGSQKDNSYLNITDVRNIDLKWFYK